MPHIIKPIGVLIRRLIISIIVVMLYFMKVFFHELVPMATITSRARNTFPFMFSPTWVPSTAPALSHNNSLHPLRAHCLSCGSLILLGLCCLPRLRQHPSPVSPVRLLPPVHIQGCINHIFWIRATKVLMIYLSSLLDCKQSKVASIILSSTVPHISW